MRLFNAIQQYRASQVIIVGDLFHSKENRELDLFSRWRQDISGVDLLLIKGNHDILPRKWYETSDIQVFDQHHTLNGICFTHDMNTASCEADGNVHYYISGHIHPGISISGPARQQLQFPCFHFTPQYAVLPAFSHFTGLYMIRPAAGDKTYAIVNKSIIAV
jgi:DNA ligase-associated metallophosphoesterase